MGEPRWLWELREGTISSPGAVMAKASGTLSLEGQRAFAREAVAWGTAEVEVKVLEPLQQAHKSQLLHCQEFGKPWLNTAIIKN